MVSKMIPLSDKIRMSLRLPILQSMILALGRTTHLAWRIRLSQQFLSFIIKFSVKHGSSSAVKWLKAANVALQKELGQDRLTSLLPLGTDLPYSRTAGGLPRIIPPVDRGKIRSGDVKVIRFWSGLFNLYRILQVPGVLKLETITNGFTGSQEALDNYIEMIKRSYKTKVLFKRDSVNFFARLPGFDQIMGMDLSPTSFYLSRAASPSNKMSCVGILSDIWLLNTQRPDLWQEMLYYMYAVKPKVTPFIKSLQEGYSLITRLVEFDSSNLVGVKTGYNMYQSDHLMLKNSVRAYGLGPGAALSQFALKVEPAGKIRLFALLDSITQSVLQPLHLALFALLRKIPNDGTFDQEASIRRSQDKAVKAGKAYSFDLTAATDRLPALMTAYLLEMIFHKEIAESWLYIMTKRDFAFNGRVASKYNIEAGPYRYEVGQPMGGLSSWAGLAITHHWIVQMAAFRATGDLTWNENYEILGDDLVIFDDSIAEQYLVIMQELGCEINQTKSIRSPNRPVFEFAKRTCWGYNIVSGVSLGQLRAGWRVAGRVANALSFSNTGLLTSSSLLANTISRYTVQGNRVSTLATVKNSPKGYRLFALGTLSLLGTLFQQGKLSLRELMTALVNPKYSEADFSSEAVGLPLRASLNVAFSILTGQQPEVAWSKQDVRDEVFDEYESELATVMLQSALVKARVLFENTEKMIQEFAMSMTFRLMYSSDQQEGVTLSATELSSPVPMADLPPDYRLLMIQIESFCNTMLEMDLPANDTEELYDNIYSINRQMAKYNNISFADAVKYLERIENLEYKISLKEALAPGKTILESAPILGALRKLTPSVTKGVRYLQVAKLKSLYDIQAITS